jgi:very-short-patch-repair endonuclease
MLVSENPGVGYFLESFMTEFVKTALQGVRSKLLDLTRRNRLLNYKESARSIRVIDELPDEVFRLLVLEGKEMEFVPLRDERALAQGTLQGIDPVSPQNKSYPIDRSNELPQPNGTVARKHRDTRLQTPFADAVLERRCKKLLQESRTAIEETGSNLLHLAIGFVEWYESVDSTELSRAPLILVPVKIERSRIDRESNCYTYIISYTGEDIETNLSLAVKMDHDFNLVLPELDEDVLPESYFNDVASTISQRPKWRVAREMVLGLFSFSKLLMYRDLDPDRWPEGKRIIEHSNITRVLGGRQEGEPAEEQPYGEEYNIDQETGPDTTPLILDADSSQSSVIIDAIQNRENLVVEGPPGTGKSQTIGNLIAAALHRGMSVLFVAEKKAALEVVRSRLDHAGLGDFCLELHSHKTQKGQLHTDIGRRLKKVFRDAGSLEYEIKDLARERERLVAYSKLVNSRVGPSGETVYDIFWAAERCRTELKVQPPRFCISKPLNLSREEINDRVHLLRDVARLRLDLTDDAIRAWRDFIPGVILPGDESEVGDSLAELQAQIESYCSYLEDRLRGSNWPLPLTLDQLHRLRRIKTEVLGELPHDFNQKLARQFTSTENVETLEGLDNAISEYRHLLQVSEVMARSLDGEANAARIRPIADITGQLEAAGHGDSSIRALNMLSEKLAQAITLLVRLDKAAVTVQDFLADAPERIGDYGRVTELNRVLEALPEAMAGWCCPEYTLESAGAEFLSARANCKNLAGQLARHGQFFLLRYIPKRSELAELARGLRSYRGSLFAIFSSQYRTIRRTIKGLLVDPKSCKAPDLVERLEGLVDSLNAVADIRSNEEIRKKLGPLFNGIETDWDKLKACITWGGEFSKAVGSQHLASSLAPRLTEITPIIAAESKTICETCEELAPFRVQLGLADTDRVTDVITRLQAEKDRLDAMLEPLLAYPRLQDIDITSLAEAAQSFLSADHLLAGLDDECYRRLLGTEYRRMDTATAQILKTARWIGSLNEQGRIPEEIVAWLVADDTVNRRNLLEDILAANGEFLEHCDGFVATLARHGELSKGSLFCADDQPCTLDNYLEAVILCRENLRFLITWGDYRRAMGRANSLGLESFSEAIDSGRINPDESSAIYRHAAYDGMARELIARYPALASFTRAEYDGIRERFASLDKRIMNNTRERIAHKSSSRHIPKGIGYGPVRDYTDRALIERELQKQKRHIPIRQLVRRAGRALQAIKPCFMMSPLSVAQYLEPGQINFDLVVMDEASQLKPEDALGAIARASQLIVVGDPNQLPPTSFFDRSEGVIDEEEEVAAIQDTESILDICLTTYRKRRLRWHYRSEHESLIAFSNQRFYDNDLIIFPSPIGKNRNYGVHRHYIDGATYLKGRNRVEAEAVALAVVEHFRSQTKHSLGVATFNREQAELILDVLDRLQKENTWLESAIKETESSEEPFFVKNLENVQGDERDIIFVGTTYGPDPSTNRVFQRFGPIAGDTGWRRLNVIFTRAKKRLELFTSLRSADIKFNESPSKGTLALKGYLEYAETGILPDYATIGSRDPDSDFEISVAHHLNLQGFRTVAQVGVAGFFIDIGVMHPERSGEFILGVECDGAAYHSAKSVRDRDRLRQEILEKKGWKIHRIWSTDWFKNRDREVQRLINSVRQALEEQQSVVTPLDNSHEEFDARLADLLRQIKEPEPAAKTARQEVVAEKASKSLREELIEYRQTNIDPNFPDQAKGILRDEVLDRLVRLLPLTREEFYKAVPMNLRQHTDSQQMQYLEDILEIIDAYA